MIKVGDKIPDVKLFVLSKEGKPTAVSSHALFAGKRAVLFAIPAAFSPGCSNLHCPSYVKNAQKLKSAGFDFVAMTAVNDAWTLNAFSEHLKAGETMTMLALVLADGNADFTIATGLATDMTAVGGGKVRSRRYAMVVEDLVVKHLALDKMELVTAEAILNRSKL